MTDYPQAYIEYLVQFHGHRDYFECHEVMEEHWKETAGSAYSKRWLTLIQVAVGAYHERRGNRAGALKMLETAVRNAAGEDWTMLGMDGPAFLVLLDDRIRKLGSVQEEPYAEPDLPLSDPELIRLCLNHAQERNVVWLAASDFADADIIHKHLRRDRSQVERERANSLAKKRSSRSAGNGWKAT